MNNNYYCYNPIKRDYLKQLGIKPIDAGVHKKTNRTFWAYERNTKLDKALTQWRLNGNIK